MELLIEFALPSYIGQGWKKFTINKRTSLLLESINYEHRKVLQNWAKKVANKTFPWSVWDLSYKYFYDRNLQLWQNKLACKRTLLTSNPIECCNHINLYGYTRNLRM